MGTWFPGSQGIRRPGMTIHVHMPPKISIHEYTCAYVSLYDHTWAHISIQGQRRTTCDIQNGSQGATKWRQGVERHKHIWSKNLGGALTFHALITSLCSDGCNTHKTQQSKCVLKHGIFLGYLKNINGLGCCTCQTKAIKVFSVAVITHYFLPWWIRVCGKVPTPRCLGALANFC